MTEEATTHGVLLNHPITLMRFTLVYDGPLPAQKSKGEGRTYEKHQIRTQLHGQLAELWGSREALRANLGAWRERYAHGESEEHDVPSVTPFRRGPFLFTPLVRASQHLLCELDILFLRAEPRGSVFTANEAGDLDNRLKVLFDALRVPKNEGELPNNAAPIEGQLPFFCLLEDDRLITAVRLESERLLDVPPGSTHARAVIRVKVKAQRLTPFSLHFASDD